MLALSPLDRGLDIELLRLKRKIYHCSYFINFEFNSTIRRGECFKVILVLNYLGLVEWQRDASLKMKMTLDDNLYNSWHWHMGASLKNCLCAGIETVNNRLDIFHRRPTTCFGVRHKTIAFQLQSDAVKIVKDYDQFMNTDSVISQENLTVKLLKNSEGIVTSPRKISQIIYNMIVELDGKAVQKIVFKEPRASSNNKEMICRAIFEALYNFSSIPILHTKSVYMDWMDLTAGEMKEIGREMMRERTILAKQ